MSTLASQPPPAAGVVRVCCIGDVVGRPGRNILGDLLPQMREQWSIEAVIVNAENIASGSGITPSLYQKVIDAGADLVTMGDHIYRRNEAINLLKTSDRIVRPANYPRDAPGREFAHFATASGHGVAVISIMGRLYMKPQTDCPFRAVDRVLSALPSEIRVVVVDMHAEATGEKVAMGWHLDGRVSLLFGTHTHVPTADETILPKGTGYITDLGMTGPYDSVLGRRKDRVIGTLISAIPSRFEVAEHDVRICGILADVDPKSGRTVSLRRFAEANGGPP